MATRSAGAQPEHEAPADAAFRVLHESEPYPVYAKLRDQAPVHRSILPNGRPVWVVMGYDEAQAVLKDQRFGKDVRRREGTKGMQMLLNRRPFRNLTQNMLRLDPPDHSRLRALVLKAFTPRRVETLAPHIQAHAEKLIDAVIERGRMDLIADYAGPLPVDVIAELMGIPAADRPQLVLWSHALLKLSSEMAFGMDTSIKGMIQLAQRLTARSKGHDSVLRMMTAFSDYLQALIEERRAAPGDDLVSGLIAARDENDALSDDELLSMLLVIFMAGHETTTHLIGNGMLALLLHPDQLERLRGEPELIKPAVEEFLRYNGPILAVPRYAMEDAELGGHLIRKNAEVMVVLAAANHDPAYAACPHALDIARQNAQHMALGSGIHYCLGAALGRLEGQIAINALIRRLPNLRLAVPPESLPWQTGRLQRGLLSMPVEF